MHFNFQIDLKKIIRVLGFAYFFFKPFFVVAATIEDNRLTTQDFNSSSSSTSNSNSISSTNSYVKKKSSSNKSASSMKQPERKSYTQKSDWNLVLPSFVVHGLQPDSVAAANMPNKLIGNGDAVTTPGFGLQYNGSEGGLFVGALIKDCYNNLAGTVQVGESWGIDKTSSWGLTFGIYARETPYTCKLNPNGSSTCVLLDTYSLKFVSTINGESVDIIPLPFLHYSSVLYKDRDLEVDFKLMANFILNEVGLIIPF